MTELQAYSDTADSHSADAPWRALRNFLAHPDTQDDFRRGVRQRGGLVADCETGLPGPQACSAGPSRCAQCASLATERRSRTESACGGDVGPAQPMDAAARSGPGACPNDSPPRAQRVMRERVNSADSFSRLRRACEGHMHQGKLSCSAASEVLLRELQRSGRTAAT